LASGNTSRSAPQKPSAPSPIASTGARIPGALQIAHDLSPRLLRLAVAVTDRHQLHAPVRAHADQYQAAQPVLLQPDFEADPARPHVHVVHLAQVANPRQRKLSTP
jgi:hypothetical protein